MSVVASRTRGSSSTSNTVSLPVDVSVWEDVDKVVTETVAEFGALHVMVNNAAISPKLEGGARMNTFDTSAADWLRVAVVTDRSDGKLAHLDGLNISRAWMLEGMASGLPESDVRRPALLAAAEGNLAGQTLEWDELTAVCVVLAAEALVVEAGEKSNYILSSAFNFRNRPATILVRLPDGKRVPAKLVATDHNRMLALLKIDGDELPALVAYRAQLIFDDSDADGHFDAEHERVAGAEVVRVELR